MGILNHTFHQSRYGCESYLLHNFAKLGFKEPTPIQQQAIPVLLSVFGSSSKTSRVGKSSDLCTLDLCWRFDLPKTNSEQQTAIGSSNVPNTADEPVGIQSNVNFNLHERFVLEVSDNYVKKTLGKNWRDHKTTLKKEYFKKNISLEEKLRNVLSGILRYQWEDAIRFWNPKKGERVGTTTRQKQKFTHTAGSKSFACVADDEVFEFINFGCLQLFDITHRKKDGSPMTTEAAEIMKKLKDKRAEYKSIASSDSSINFDNIDN
ncbi:hypothetical protein PVK06_020951 [Gossypium arboreum]|uniref:DEAD-box RNA helicase Q domain-containing protein n=1 Tax=Gossypium arboreum TaxID=29729 RepID=A0ABR0PP66_GOSAR|nr:hypothetical protein PVK06_020951 [Gossypium arboreum]